MCEIKRLNKLKSMSVAMVSRIAAAAPLSSLVPQYVSPSGLTYTDIKEKLEKIANCASIVELKSTWSGTPDNLEQTMSVAAANYCKQHTVCPVCADRSQARRRAKYNDAIKKQASRVKDGNRFAYLVTYTIKDGGDLSERLEHLKQAKRTFRRMGQKRNKTKHSRSQGESAKIRAAISTIEIKRGCKSEEWHTHMHDLVFTDQPLDYQVYDSAARRDLYNLYGDNIPKSELMKIAKVKINFDGETVPVSKISAEWLRATGGDSIGIDVARMTHIPKNAIGKKRQRFYKMTFEESIAYQAKEVLKYCTKPMKITPIDSLEIIDKTYNKRMVASYGEFRGICGDDYVDAPGIEDETFVLLWNKSGGGYDDPQPGKMRDFTGDESEHETRSMCGKITGEYRRTRKNLISRRGVYGDSLHRALDDAKQVYRSSISALWSLHRQRSESIARAIDGGRYSSVVALDGAYFPGSDRREIYGSI